MNFPQAYWNEYKIHKVGDDSSIIEITKIVDTSDLSYQEFITERFVKAKTLYEQGEIEEAVILLKQLTNVQGIQSDELKLMTNIFQTKINKLIEDQESDESLITYDKTAQHYYDYIEILRATNQNDKINENQKILFNLLSDKASYLVNLNEENEAYKIYLEMLSVDKFNPYVHEKMGEYQEKRGRIAKALQSYEFALRLDPENDHLIEKIEELKKIADE